MLRKKPYILKEPFFAQSDEIYNKNKILFTKKERTEDELKTTHNLFLTKINFLEKSHQFFSTTSSKKFGLARTNITIINKALADNFYDLAGIFYEKLQFTTNKKMKINLLLERIHFLEKSLELYNIADDIDSVIKEIAESNESVGDLYIDENNLNLAKDAYARAIVYLKKSILPTEETEIEWQIDIYISLFNAKYNLEQNIILEKDDQLRLKNLVNSLPISKKSKKQSELNEYFVESQLTSAAKIKKIINFTPATSEKRKQPEKNYFKEISELNEVKSQTTSVAQMKKIRDSSPSMPKKRKQPERSHFKKLSELNEVKLKTANTKKITDHTPAIPEKKPAKKNTTQTMPRTEEKPLSINTLPSSEKYHLLDCLLHIAELRKIGSALDIKPIKPSKDIDGICLVHVNPRIKTPSKIIAYEVDNVIFDKAASFNTLTYQFICLEKIKEVAKYVSENNILLVLLTQRAESDYYYSRSPFSCHEIANKIFGLNNVNDLIYTNNLPGGKGKACQILWDHYFSGLPDSEKSNRICVVDYLPENISSIKETGFKAIQIISHQEERNHQEVLTFAHSVSEILTTNKVANLRS